MDYDIELRSVAFVASGNQIKNVRLFALSILEEALLDQFSMGARHSAARMIENFLFRAEELDHGAEALQRRENVIARLRSLEFYEIH